MRRSRGSRGRPPLQRAGAALILAGFVLFATTTAGFTSTAADRGANVTIAGDADAYLGISDQTDTAGSTLSFNGSESVTVYSLDDNAGMYDASTTDDVSATLLEFGDDTSSNLTVDVLVADDGHDWQVELQCGTEDRDLAAASATVRMTASGDNTVVAERTTDHEVDPNCGS